MVIFKSLGGAAVRICYAPALLIIWILEILTVRSYMFYYYWYKHRLRMLYERRVKGLYFFKFSVTRVRGIWRRNIRIYKIKYRIYKFFNIYELNIRLVRTNLALLLFLFTFFSEIPKVFKQRLFRLILLSLIVIRRRFNNSQFRGFLQLGKIMRAKLRSFF